MNEGEGEVVIGLQYGRNYVLLKGEVQSFRINKLLHTNQLMCSGGGPCLGVSYVRPSGWPLRRMEESFGTRK